MNCLNLNVPQFRQAVAILGKGVATEIVNTFDPDYLPSLDEILEKHVNPARLNTTKGEPNRTKQLRDIYDNNAELRKAGSFESYMAYIDSIFPESIVRDIVYHGTMPGTATATNANSGDANATFPGYVTYFSTARTYAESLGIKDLVKVVLPAIVNVKNPYYATSPIADTPRGTQFTGPRNIKEDMPQHDAVVGSDAGQTIGNTVAVFNPQQIHVLGSKKDIADFKNFMSGPKIPEAPTPGTVKSLTPKQQMVKEQTNTLLTPAEAKDLYDSYMPQSFMTMLRSWFFKVPTTNSNEKDAFRIVDASFLAYKAGREAYGAYIDGVLYLANLGTAEQPLVDRDVLKHELVHKIMWSYLSAQERNTLLKAVSEKYNIEINADNLELIEEYIADEFINYKKSPMSAMESLKLLLRKIFRALGLVGLHYKEMNKFFGDIANGMFSGAGNKDVRVTRLMEKRIRKRFGTIENYKKAKQYVLTTITTLTKFNNIEVQDLLNKDVVSAVRKSVPYTFDEAINEAKKQITLKLRAFEKALMDKQGLSEEDKQSLNLINTNITNLKKQLEDESLTQFDKDQIQNKLAIYEKLRGNKMSVMMGDLSKEIKENYDMIRALSNDANFDTIIDYLYPNASQYVATEGSDDSSIDEAVKSEEVYNLKDEIGSKEDIDLRMNIISRVKQILATIEYTTDEGERAYVPFNMAYAVLLKIMGNFDTSRNPNEQIKYLELAINNYGSSPMLTAIKDKLRNLIIDAYPRHLETDIPQFQFKSDSVAVLDTLGQNVRFTSLDTILYNIEKNNATRYVVYRKRDNESQKDFLVRITNDLRNRYASDPNKEVAKLFNITSIVSSYRRFVNLNILANIHTSLVSMRERAPFIAERRYRSGKLVFDYYSVKDSGSNSVYSSQIRESILAKIRSGFIGNISSRVSQAELNQKKQQAQDFRTSSGIFRFGKSLPANPPIAKKIELIKSFIKLIDNRMLNNVIKKNPNAINASDVVYITSLYSGLENLLNVLNTTDLDSDPSELINTLELKFTSLLASKLSNLDEELAPVNYISGDGKGRYKFALSSWGMEVFKKLAVGVDSWIKDGLFAYMDTEFYKRNLFIENRTRILKYFDHDSSKYKGLDTSAVLHKNETPSQWFSRNFNHMFLGALINSNFNNYFQQVFTISDKPNIVGAQVEFIKPNQESSIMRKLVEQEAYRNKQLVGKVKNYTPEKSYLVGVSKAVTLRPDGTLDENDVNRAMDEFEKGLQQIAESILDYILNNKVMIHGEIESHMEKFLTPEQMKQWKNDKLFNTTIKTLFENLRKSKFEESQKASEVDEDSDTNQSEDEFGSDTETGMELLDLNAFKEQRTERPGEAALNQTYDQYYAENLANLRRYLAPMARSLAVNFYINSHQLNQMLAGDLAFYKTGTEAYDIIKRLSLVFAPGKSGAVNDTYYLPKETKIAVVEDLKEFITDKEAKDSGLPEIAGDNMDTTDAQVYMTPEYYEKLKLAHGTESNQGYILKPVFFGISPEGVPVSVKCSVVVLTDELVDQFPGLAKVRTMLNQKQVDMLAFESAIKMGMPANLTKLFARDEKGKIITNPDGSLKLVDEELAVPSEIEDQSILTLDTRNFRLQFNPAKKVIGKVTNPSQMTYMGAINEDTIELVDSILERNAKIIKFGRTVVNRTFRLFNGKPTKSKGLTRKIVKNKLISTLANINGSETEADILDNPEASLNLPMIVNKMINNITSVFQKNTVDIKIKGAKLNLQSEFGTFAKSVAANKPRLKWRDKNGLTEVYVSEELLKELGLNIGDVIVDKGFKAMAFRIPSSGLHSGIALIIKGTYPSPDPTSTNVIIAPSRIVHVHGSDYDIDSLSVIIRTRTVDVFGENATANLGALIDKALAEDTTYGENGFVNNLQPNQVMGYTNYNPNNLGTSFNEIMLDYNGTMIPLEDLLEIAIERVRERASSLIADRTMDKDLKKRMLYELIGDTGKYDKSLEYKLIKAYQAIHKNKIVDNFVDLLTTATSRKWGDMPISMSRFNVPKVETRKVASVTEAGEPTQKELSSAEGLLSIVARMTGKKGNNWREILYPPVDPSNVLHQGNIHRNSTSGLVIRGGGANAIKMFAYSLLGARVSHFQSITDPDDIISPKDAKELAKTPEGRTKLRGYKRVRERVMLDPSISVRFNGVNYDSLSTKELTKSDAPGAEPNEKMNKEVIVKFDKDGNPIMKNYSVWETLDSIINAAIDNVKEQIIYLINLTGGTASEYFAAIMLGIPMDTLVRFMVSPSLYELSFTGDIKKGEKFQGMLTLMNKVTDKLILEEFLATKDADVKKMFFTKMEELKPQEQLLINEVRAEYNEFLENYDSSIELTDANMEASAIFINQAVETGNFGTMTNMLYSMLGPTDASPQEAIQHLLVQIKVMEQYRQLSTIGSKLFTAQTSMDTLRQLDPTYEGLKGKVEDMINQVSSFGGERNILESFNKTIIPVLSQELGPIEEVTMEELKQYKAGKKSKKRKKKTEDSDELSTREIIIDTLIKYIESAKGVEVANRNAINQLLRGKDSNYSTPAIGWPFINSSLLSIPNVRESFISAIQLVTFLENLIVKHSIGMNKMTSMIATRIGSVSSFSSKYKLIEDVKNQFINYYLSGASLQFGSYSFDVTLSNNNIKDWVANLKKDIIALREYLSDQGTPNAFLDSIEFSNDRSLSGATKLVFTAHKKNDPEVEAELKSAFNRLGSTEVKTAIMLLKRKQAQEGTAEYTPDPGIIPNDVMFSDISMRLIKYLVISKGLDFGRVSYSSLLPDSFYSAISNTIDNEMDKFSTLDIKLKNSTEYSNRSFLALMDDFITQFAINNSSKLQSYTNKDVVLTDGQEEGYMVAGDYEYHYDLLVKSYNSPEFVTYKYGKQVRVYRRFKEHTVEKDDATADTPAGKYSMYRFIGYSNFNRHYTLYQNNKSNGYYSVPLLNFPIVRVKNNVGISTFEANNVKTPYKKGMVVIMIPDSVAGINKPIAYTITGVTVNGTTNVTYAIKPTSGGGIVDTTFDPSTQASNEGGVLNPSLEVDAPVNLITNNLNTELGIKAFEDSLDESLTNTLGLDTVQESTETDPTNEIGNDIEDENGTSYLMEFSDGAMAPEKTFKFVTRDEQQKEVTDPKKNLSLIIKFFSNLFSRLRRGDRVSPRLGSELSMIKEVVTTKLTQKLRDRLDVPDTIPLSEVDNDVLSQFVKKFPLELGINSKILTSYINELDKVNTRLAKYMPGIKKLLDSHETTWRPLEWLSTNHTYYSLESFVDQLIPLIGDPAVRANLLELVRLNPNAKLALTKVLSEHDTATNKINGWLGSYSWKHDLTVISLSGDTETQTDSQWATKLATTLSHELAHRSSIVALNKYLPLWQKYTSSKDESILKQILVPLQNIFKAYEEMKVLASTITDEELMELSEVNDNVRYVMNKRTLNYAFSNVKEFVAYMYSDPTFKKIVENLGTKLAYKTKAQEPQTFTAKFVNNLKKWFRDLLEFLLGRQLVFTKDREEYTSVLGSMKNLYSISLYSSRIRKDANEVAALLDKTKDGKDYLIETRDDDEVDEGGEDTDEEAIAAEKDDSRNEQTESLNKIISSDNVDGVMLQSDTDEGKYQDKNGNLYNRLTEFVSNIFFSSMSGKVREPEYYATKDFSDRGVPITEKISKKVDNGKEQLFTYDELVEYHKRKSNNYKTWGKAAHAFIELLLTQDEAKKKEIEARLQELVKPRFDEDGRQISDPVDLSAMQWLTGMDRNVEISLQQVLTAAGITLNLKNQKFNKSLQSISLPELAIVLPGLDVGTTIDNLFIDADGTYSILDWKTGALLSDFNNPEIMKWGANEGINLTKLNKAKLEVVMRMMAIKLANPDAKFKNMSVIWIGGQGRYKIHNIDMQPFLNALAEYTKTENPSVYNEYVAKGLFDSKNYVANNKYQSVYEDSIAHMDLAGKLEWTKSRIQFLQLKYASPNVPHKEKIKRELKDLSKLLVELEGTPGINYDAPSKDMSSLSKVTSNIKDVQNPTMKVFAKTMLTNKFEAEKEQSELNEEYNKMFDPVLQEYLEKNPAYKALYTMSGGRISSLFGAGLNKKQLYSFMWKYHDSEAKKGYYANTDNTYTDLTTNEQNIPMTKAQMEFRDWYLSKQKNLYNEVARTELLDDKGKKVEKWKLQKLPEGLYEDFMPRMQKSKADILESNISVFKKARDVIQTTLLETFTDVFEHTYEGDPTRGIPLRYYSGVNSEVITSEEHTFDIEEGFKQFTNNLIFKKHMDEVYSFGEALKFYFAEAKNEFGKQLYPNLTKFLEDQILMHILQTTPQGNFFGKEFSINVTPKMVEKYKGLNLQEGRITLNAWKISRAIKNWVSLSMMTFKLIPAAGNAALIIISNHFKGFTGSLATRVFGIPPQDVEFTMSDILAADAAILKYWGKRMLGIHKDDKLYNMTRRLKFLPDNYDFYTNREDMKVVKNALFSTNSLYVAHSIFEEYGAMTMLYAGLKASRFTFTHKETGEVRESNLYDMYDNQGNYDNNWVRGKIKQGDNFIEIGAITADELQKFKRFHERVHGSYRREERLTAELTVMGQWAMQFKKYLPTLFKMNWKGPDVDRYLGGYKVKLDANGFPVKDEGIDVMEWEEKLTQGRVNLLLKSLFVTAKIMPFLGVGEEKGYDTTKYIWENMSNERKKIMIEAVATILLFMVLPVLLMGGFDDDDKNKAWYQRINKIFEDASLGMDPRDLLRPLADNPVPAIKYLIDLLDNGTAFFAEGLIMGDKDSRGLPQGAYGLMRQLPLGASWHQWNSFMDDYDKNLQFWSYDQR